MVLLINLIPLIIVLCGGFFLYRGYKAGKTGGTLIAVAACTLFTLFLYFKAQPSYMPKGDIKRTEIPALSASPSAQIEDRNRQPVPQMDRRAQQEEQYREGPVFLKEDQKP